jgi:hypothetical protein
MAAPAYFMVGLMVWQGFHIGRRSHYAPMILLCLFITTISTRCIPEAKTTYRILSQLFFLFVFFFVTGVNLIAIPLDGT